MGEHFSAKKVPPRPFKKALTKNIKKIPKIRIDGRREGKPRFGCREQSGTAKTLPVKRVVVKQCVLDGPQKKQRDSTLAIPLIVSRRGGACSSRKQTIIAKQKNGRPMVAPAINSIIYSVGAIHESPVFIY